MVMDGGEGIVTVAETDAPALSVTVTEFSPEPILIFSPVVTPLFQRYLYTPEPPLGTAFAAPFKESAHFAAVTSKILTDKGMKGY